jgi:oligopeptidase A
MSSLLHIGSPIQWSTITPSKALTDIPFLINAAKEQIENLQHQPPTYEGTVLALDDITTSVFRAWNLVQHINTVNNSPELREAIQTLQPLVSDFSSSIFINEDLWNIFQEATKDRTQCSSVQLRHVEEVEMSFRLNGALLTAEEKATLVSINRRMAEITQTFSNNVLDDKQRWELIVDDEKRLTGIPESTKRAAFLSAQSKGFATEEDPKWRLTLDYPSFIPVMRYADDESLRKEMYEASVAVGRSEQYNNLPVVKEILTLRQQKAELLGFNNFSDLILNTRMAKNGDTALNFVEGLFDKTKVHFDRETIELKAFKADYLAQESEVLRPWEISYFSEKMQLATCNISDEELRPYFNVNRVMDGFFELAKELFGIKIARVSSTQTGTDTDAEFQIWHENVRVYQIHDGDGTYIGMFYADLFPREGKRGGAWMNPLYTSNSNGYKGHIGLICGNFNPPVDGQPALLTHREVETVFHEMGHLLHHMLGESEVPSLHGTSVAWDFVELPSQIMENWCWERELLQRFANHNDTGEVISDELLEKMTQKRNFRSASAQMRQLRLGKLDLSLHLASENWSEKDIDSFLKPVLDKYSVPSDVSYPSHVAQFGHLFSGPVAYASGYYSYKWAEVLDADAFSRFKKEGIFNTDVGLAYRNTILSRGNTAPPDTLFRDFMGRDPDANALLKRADLL